MKRGPYRQRFLMRDTILEAIRQGNARIRRPKELTGRTWADNASDLGLIYDAVSNTWSPTRITFLAVEDYIARRLVGDSPLAVNDVYPLHLIACGV